MNRGFWKGRRVLVTGHTGFKGSWLSLWLQKLGALVVGYSLPAPTKPCLFEVANVADGMTSITGDVRDLTCLKADMAKYEPEIIIHMAAQPLVRRSYDDPVETYGTNVMGTLNVLEAVRHVGTAKAVVCITSDKCYENKEWNWGYRENDELGGRDPYSSSKACAEKVISAYRHSYFSGERGQARIVAVASARAGNVIGGGDWAKDRLIPDIMTAILDDSPVVIRKPTAIRPWQHVLEPLCGYLMLAEHLWTEGDAFAQSWNFGPSDLEAKTVSWVVGQLMSLWGNGPHWEFDGSQHPHEDTFLKLDSSKARTLLGWAPRLTPLSTSLAWVVEWYRDYKNNQNMRDCTEAQIARYEKQLTG